MDIEINDLHTVGEIADVEDYQLPPEAFSLSENMRYRGQGIERVFGRRAVFGTPPVAPHFALTLRDPAGAVWWPYVSLTKGYVWDGTTHTNITRQTTSVDVDYAASATRDWNGTILGGIPIFNNGVDIPQFWATLSSGQKLQNLTNWPTTLRAKVVRSYGPYLLALNCLKSSTAFPHMVKWSHPADPGSVPISWDETDPALDAGEKELADADAGVIVDGLDLSGRFFVYKENSVWRVTEIGGQYIFDWGTSPFLKGPGLLSARCLAVTGEGSRHVFASQDDIMMHDGNSADSILSERWKKRLRDSIDSVNYVNSFMYCDPQNDEIVFCFPEAGEVNPSRALVWNYKLGAKGGLSERPLTQLRNVAVGNITDTVGETWASDTGTWAEDTTPWSATLRRKLVGLAPDVSKFYLLDDGVTNDGVNFTGTLRRTGLGMVGRKRNGEWIVDFTKQKLVRRLWVKGSGGPVTVRVGAADTPDGPVSWSEPETLDTATQNWVEPVVSGKALAVEFTCEAPFRLMGYKFELADSMARF